MAAQAKRWKVVAPVGAAVLAAGAGAGYWAISDDPQPAATRVLECGTFDFPACDGPDDQFDPVFVDEATALPAAGGFGGGECGARRTPVVFVHGNADRAINWDSAITSPVEGYPAAPASVYDTLLADGYRGCELFGLTYLSGAEQDDPGANYHSPAKYAEVIDFIDEVKASTGRDKVDIVSHSLGVSMTMAALTWHDETNPDEPSAWGGVRRFVNVAGGVHGLGSCKLVGPANPVAKTCGSQNIYDKWTFGFYPDAGLGLGANQWTAARGDLSLRAMPSRHPKVAFYTISAGDNDQVHCGAMDFGSGCVQGPLFTPADNVRSQLDVGAGSRATDLAYDPSQGFVLNLAAGDKDGVGHFKAKNNTGQIILQMLRTECRGMACVGDYEAGPVEAAA